jgi:dTDP-4-dehydrorhamnose reductase
VKILVIGANGYLGSTIYMRLKDNFNDDIYGTGRRSTKQNLIKIDVLKKVDIQKVLSLKPDIIIWSIMNQEQEMLLSEIGLNEIVNNISSKVRLIYISTTIGIGKNQDEHITPQERKSDEYLAKYVNGKIVGESIVKKHSDYVIVRPGSIYGYNYNGEMDERMKGLLEISQTGKQYSRTANMYASFVNVEDLADAIIEIAYNDLSGIINISGERSVSHYDFNVYLAGLMGIDNGFIIPDYKQEDVYHNLSNDKRKSLLNTVIRDI